MSLTLRCVVTKVGGSSGVVGSVAGRPEAAPVRDGQNRPTIDAADAAPFRGAPRPSALAKSEIAAWRTARFQAAARATISYVSDLAFLKDELRRTLLASAAARLHSGWDAAGLVSIGSEVFTAAQAAELAQETVLAESLYIVAEGIIELAEKKLPSPSLVALKLEK